MESKFTCKLNNLMKSKLKSNFVSEDMIIINRGECLSLKSSKFKKVSLKLLAKLLIKFREPSRLSKSGLAPPLRSSFKKKPAIKDK